MSRLSVFAALAFAASAVAVSNLQVPSSATPDNNVTITWTSDSSDPSPLTLALFSADNNQTFAGGLAIANDVNVGQNQITILFPQLVSPGSYTVSFLSPSNASATLATSPAFSVNAAAAAAPPSSSSNTNSGSRTGSGSATATSPAPAPSGPSASLSLSSLSNSINSAASSALSSAQSVASSAASSPSTGAALSLSPPMNLKGLGTAVAVVLGGVVVGALAL